MAPSTTDERPAVPPLAVAHAQTSDGLKSARINAHTALVQAYAEAGQYIRGLLDSKMLYGSWCCSRTNFHHPGATAFFTAPPKLPLGREAQTKREARGY